MPWPPAGWTLHPDKGCMFNIEDGERGPTWWTTQVVLVKDGCAVPTGVPGNYFVVGDDSMKVSDSEVRSNTCMGLGQIGQKESFSHLWGT